MANMNLIGQPSGDLTSTSGMTNDGPVRVPEGDLTTSSTSSTLILEERNRENASISNHAGPITSSTDLRNRRAGPQGTIVERPSIVPERPLHDMHINIVASQATKRLIQGMLQHINLEEFEKREVQEIRDRRQSCMELLKMWKRKGRNQRSVKDLMDLVISADETSEQFQTLARQVCESPP
uniref:uncharacterized protein LOC100180888 n=1 Tax=Ciona intestinalis TaxID=7719 RepID=UPI000180CED7|nr:uncharacterized protein LOC100180888 [Ciona intestinalis]|eukprot:XP_002132170.1 uncharacterized protein LOC100180888 [Ciona intestinalis]